METLEFIRRPVDGKLIIDLPIGWEEKELEVTIREIEAIADVMPKFKDMAVEEKKAELKAYYGSAKFPDYPTDKFDVYDQ